MSAVSQLSSNIAFESIFLAGLRPDEIKTICASATERHFAAGAIITRQGTAANRLYLLSEGRARYFVDSPNGDRTPLMWVTRGGVLGGAALCEAQSIYLASAEAVRDCTVLTWNRPTIRALAKRFPILLANTVEIASEYLSWYADTQVTLTSRTAPERLAHVLTRLIGVIGEEVADGVELEVTNEELADTANITPYTTSRILSRWQKRGLVHKYRGKILVLSPDKLSLGSFTR